VTGTLLNILTVLVGGSLGLGLGGRVPERIRQTVVAGLGLFTLGFGVRMFLQTRNPIAPLVGLLVGGLLGEWWRIEDRLEALGVWLESRLTRGSAAEPGSRFVRGFLTASLVFCVGPMTVLGSLQDGLTGNYELLAVKSTLDGFGALAFASTLGPGVLFSTLIIALYQGSLTLLAAQAQAVLSDPMVAEMTAAGGVILVGIAISSLLEIRKIRSANLLPALAVAPAVAWIFSLLGIG
jgi:uncharacterized membrane protein YqgA involved in biofilm formation